MAGDSLDQAVLKSDEISTGPPDFHTPRRSRTAHYGCVRHALRYLGVDISVPGAIEVLRQYDDWPDGKLDLAEFSRLVEDLM